MTEHLHDEIPRLLTGEADRDTVRAAGSHLRECADCTEELIAAVVAHASLESAARHAPEVVTGVPLAPSPRNQKQPAPEPEPLPDLSSMFARIREEAGAGATSSTPPPRRRRHVRLIAAAAVVGVGLASGAGYYAADQLSGPEGRTVQVAAFGVGTTNASATLLGNDEIKLNASSLPPTTAGNYYEVWLTDANRQQMAPLGPLTADRKGSFTVSPALLDNYSAIEVSVQNASGTGAYSGTSVLRGSYR